MKHADKCESCAHWVSDSLISHPADHYGESGRFRYSVTFKLGICHVGSRSVVMADASPDGGRTGRRPAWRTTVPIDGPVMTLAESGCERWTARPTHWTESHDDADGPGDVTSFRSSLTEPAPPALGAPLQALWWDAKGDWQKAHGCAQADEGTQAAWVHAYLHRKEGDRSNAAYWYKRAGKPVAKTSLGEEWDAIARDLLNRPGRAAR